MVVMFRWHTGQNEGVTGTSEDHDLRSSTGEFCMCIHTGAAGERYFSAAWNLSKHGSAQLWLKKRFSTFSQRENRQICWCVRYIGRLFAPVTAKLEVCLLREALLVRIGIHPARKYSGTLEVQLVPIALYIYMNIQLTILTSNFFHT